MRDSQRRLDPQKSLVGFMVGDVHYALDIARVSAIVNPPSVTALPHTPDEVAGVTDHRGEVVPVLDLRVRFGLPRVPSSRSTKCVMLRDLAPREGGRTVGLLVDSVTEVFGTGRTELSAAPAVGGPVDRRAILGVTSHAGALTFVLDPDRLVATAELAMRASELPPARKEP